MEQEILEMIKLDSGKDGYGLLIIHFTDRFGKDKEKEIKKILNKLCKLNKIVCLDSHYFYFYQETKNE